MSMKIIKFKQAFEYKNSDNCVVKEYNFKDKDIDFSTGTIKGRYPDKGFCVNKEVKEMVYIIGGEGSIFMKDAKTDFSKGDAIFIEKNEPILLDCKL